MDEIFRDLERLRYYGTMLQDLVGEFQRSAPERSEGTDPTGSVRAVLGRDGLPETIRVSGYWKEKLQPAAFGSAVTAACQAAMQRRGAEWAETMQRAGWQDRLARLDADADAAAARHAADPNPVPPAFRRSNGRPPRSLDAIAEQTMSLMDSTLSAVPQTGPGPQAPQGTGANRTGTLQLSVSSEGLVSCQADPRWVAQQTGAQLSAVLAELLATARTRLAAAVSAASAPGDKVKEAAADLQAEIMSVLANLLASTDQQSGTERQ